MSKTATTTSIVQILFGKVDQKSKENSKFKGLLDKFQFGKLFLMQNKSKQVSLFWKQLRSWPYKVFFKPVVTDGWNSMGKKIWLSLNVRNFGSDKIVRTYLSNVRMYILLPLYVSLGKIWHFKHPRVLAVIRIVTYLDFQREKNNNNTETFFRLNFTVYLG